MFDGEEVTLTVALGDGHFTTPISRKYFITPG